MKSLMKWVLLAGICLGTSQFARADVSAAADTSATAVTADQAALAEAQAKAEKQKAAEKEKKAAARFAKCDKCHEDNELMHGKHAKVINPNTDKPVVCTNCHGTPSSKHRKQRGGMVDVMRFGDDAFPLDQQNGVCMSCHEPDSLRKSLWAHDVHANKLTCTSCHALHPDKEPMVGITEKSRIKLCVDCHSKQHEAKLKAAGKVDADAGKEAP